ncbi:hypothetical protein [Nocardioides sp.]|uniref:hypothetical protein n=1 Tax=Nocardioides sp. TaxID=35761 RepID=UPI00351684B7
MTRVQAATSAALCGAATVLLGYASGWGLSVPVAAQVVSPPAAPVASAPAAPVQVAPATVPVPVVSAPAGIPRTPTPTVPTTPAPTEHDHAPEPESPSAPDVVMPPLVARDDTCVGVRIAASRLLTHLEAGHLQTSPLDQVRELLDVDQYTLTHTTLVDSMLDPIARALDSDLDVLLRHLYAAHLETSPFQQVTDLLAVDDYVKAHTVLVKDVVGPTVGERGC